MKQDIALLDPVALIVDFPEHGLHKGEVGAVVLVHPSDYCEVARAGYTYALLPLPGSQLVALREKPRGDAKELVRLSK